MYGYFPGGSDGKESACNARDRGSIHGLGRSPAEGNGNPLHYSCLENSMDRGAWSLEPQAVVHGRKESDTTEQLTPTHVSSVYMSIPISQFFPSLLPHLDVHLFVFYVCVSIFRFADKIIHVWLCLTRNKKSIQMLVLFLWARWVILRDIRELLGNDPGEMETL